jgi:hypothetical protein
MKSQASFQMRICSQEGFGSNWLKLRWTVGLKNLNYGIADFIACLFRDFLLSKPANSTTWHPLAGEVDYSSKDGI